MNVQDRSAKLKETMDNRRSLTREQFKDLFRYVDEAIASQFILWEEIEKELVSSKKIPLSDDRTLILLLFIRNNSYFLSCLQEVETAMVDPCYNILRTIYEDILMMYYALGYPSDARVVRDYYMDKLSATDQKIVEKQRKWFKHKFLIENLYSPARQVEAKAFYKEICKRAHHEITGMMVNINYSNYSVEQCLLAILYLSFQNITALTETFHNDMSSTLEASVKDVLYEILAGIGGEYFPALEPDASTYPVALRITDWKINI